MDRRALLLALPLALGCTVQAPSVSLTSVCAPPSSGCTFASTCSAQYIGTIAVNSVEPNQLFLAVQADNRATANGDTTGGRVNSAEAFIQEVKITYSGPVAIPAASHRIIQRVPANGSSVVAFPVLDVDDNTIALGTRVTVVAKVKAKGAFADGTDFETPEFEIPVLIASDGYLGDACDAGATPTGACPGAVLAANPAQRSQAPSSYSCP